MAEEEQAEWGCCRVWLSMCGRLELQVKPSASSVSLIDLPGGALNFKQAGRRLADTALRCLRHLEAKIYS